jgi:cyclase
MAIMDPAVIRDAAGIFGAQCVTVALEVMPSGVGTWEPLVDCGRQHTGLDAETWAHLAVNLGAGELLMTSIQSEGTKQDFDFTFADRLLGNIKVPGLLHGSAGRSVDIVEVASRSYSGEVIASILHYGLATKAEIKEKLLKANIEVRT